MVEKFYPINVRLDQLDNELLEEIMKKDGKDNKSLLVRNAIHLYAFEVLGKEQVSEIIRSNLIRGRTSGDLEND